MSDLIRRQDVIDALLKMDSIVTEERIEEMRVTVDDLIKKYKDLKDGIDQHLQNYSSEQRDRKKGSWIMHNTMVGEEAQCSVCYKTLYVNHPWDGLPYVKDLFFCPFCGADMRGEEK